MLPGDEVSSAASPVSRCLTEPTAETKQDGLAEFAVADNFLRMNNTAEYRSGLCSVTMPQTDHGVTGLSEISRGPFQRQRIEMRASSRLDEDY